MTMQDIQAWRSALAAAQAIQCDVNRILASNRQKFSIGQRVELTDAGRRVLLPRWKKKVATGIVTNIITQSGDIISVRRDGLKRADTECACYWQIIARRAEES